MSGMGDTRHAYIFVALEFVGNWPLGRPRKRRKGDVNFCLREVGSEDRRWL